MTANLQRFSSIYQENDQLIRAIRLYAKRNVSSKRYQHIKGVVKTAKKLAKRFLVPLDGCAITAWAHDIAREWDPALYGTYLEIRGYVPKDDEIANPIFLHGRIAATILKERFGVVDSEILSAVTHHTLGHEELGELGKILYVADYMEPGRRYITKELFERMISQPSLNHLIQTIYQELSTKEKDFHPQTIAFFQACRLE